MGKWMYVCMWTWCFPAGSDGKEFACYAGDLGLLPGLIPGFSPWVGQIPWRRKGQPTPVFLPAKFLGQRSLVGYSPWGCKELDTAEQLTLRHTHTHVWVDRYMDRGMDAYMGVDRWMGGQMGGWMAQWVSE